MLINISFKEKDEAERFLLVCIVGLTEALLENSIRMLKKHYLVHIQ